MDTTASAPVRLSLDQRHKRAEVELANGLLLASPLSGQAAKHDGEIGRTDYEPASRELTISFRSGDSATLDIGPVECPDAPVVYLDQNHWVMLARDQWSPTNVPAPHRDGYRRLAALARERAVVLPLSSAHAFEAARKDGRQRRELGTTMLQLSRGWQMRSPLKVRRDELVGGLAEMQSGTSLPRPRPVFTLDPDALFDAPDHPASALPSTDLHVRLTWASSLAEVLIENERENGVIARAKAARWAEAYAALGVRVGEANASREDKRRTSREALLADLTNDVELAASAVGLDRHELGDWLKASEDSIAAMPAIGRIREVTHSRLSNPQYPWRVNDLTDMHFLACAAGYADFLLAENATSHDLRLAERRVPSGARICRSPDELVDLLEAER